MVVYTKSVKPCRVLQYCPYGPLVEEMPLPEEPNERCCSIFGHECPVFYCAEPFVDEGEVSDEELEEHFKELIRHWSK